MVLEGLRRSFPRVLTIEQGNPDFNRWAFDGLVWDGGVAEHDPDVLALREELTNLLRSGALEEFAFHFYDVTPVKTFAYSPNP